MLGPSSLRGTQRTPGTPLLTLLSPLLCRGCCRAIGTPVREPAAAPSRSLACLRVRSQLLEAGTWPASSPLLCRSSALRLSAALRPPLVPRAGFAVSSAVWSLRHPSRLRTQPAPRSGHCYKGYQENFSRGPGLPRTLGHAVFAASTCLAAYVGAAYVRVQREEREAASFAASPDSFFRQMDQLHKYMEELIWQTFGGDLSERRLPRRPPPSNELERAVQISRGWWARLTESERAVYGIMAANAVVFLLWQVPALHPLMCKMFLHIPSGGNPITLLTSMFSHRDVWHLGFNMFALSSIGEIACRLLGTEQFLATFLSAGICSSLFSHVFRARLNVDPHVGGLGASGALYSCFALIAMKYPDAQGSIVFLPFIPFSLGMMLPAMMTADAVGILRGWRVFDHYAHLGGALFGVAYHYYGKDVWTGARAWAVAFQRRMERA